MSFLRSLVLGALASCLVLQAAPAQARALVVHQAAIPILNRYAACVFAMDEPTAEAQIAFCSLLRKEAEQAAGEFLRKYHFGNRSPAERDLSDEFDQMEEEAARAREERKFVPVAILNYLQCMGDEIIQSEDYRDGVSVNYLDVEEHCVTEHVLTVTTVETEQELERIQILYQRFARSGRYVDRNPRLGEGIRSTGDRANARRLSRPLSRGIPGPSAFTGWRDGFLGLDVLPADKVGE